MEVTQFYLHLPSNSSLDKFPNNTLTEYRVGLSQTVNLTGDWELALTEIHYPHSWNNVRGNFQNRFYLRNQESFGTWEALIIPPGHYSSIDDILSKMNELVDNEKRFSDDVKFSYDTLSRKVTVRLQNDAEVYFGDIGYVLGFSPEKFLQSSHSLHVTYWENFCSVRSYSKTFSSLQMAYTDLNAIQTTLLTCTWN